MDYQKYCYKDKEYDLTSAVELMRKGKWQKALRTIAHDTGCSDTEAEHIGVAIKDSLPDGDKIKQKERIGSKFMLLVVIAAMLGFGYWAYGYFIMDRANFSIDEQNPGVGTEQVGEVGDFLWEIPEQDADETHQNAVNLLEQMENDEGEFFIYRNYSGEKVEDDNLHYIGQGGTLFRTNKAYFDVATKEHNYEPRFTSDYITTKFGRLVRSYLNSNCTKIRYSCEGMEPSEDYITEYDQYIFKHLFDGQTAEEYFTSRNLDISCDQISVKKVGIMPSMECYFAICNADVTTNTCDGDSIFPAAGETETKTIFVVAQCRMESLSRYELEVYDIVIQ